MNEKKAVVDKNKKKEKIIMIILLSLIVDRCDDFELLFYCFDCLVVVPLALLVILRL